jgi:hypothetical protein
MRSVAKLIHGYRSGGCSTRTKPLRLTKLCSDIAGSIISLNRRIRKKMRPSSAILDERGCTMRSYLAALTTASL